MQELYPAGSVTNALPLNICNRGFAGSSNNYFCLAQHIGAGCRLQPEVPQSQELQILSEHVPEHKFGAVLEPLQKGSI